MNRCSTASTIRQRQIKTTERYQFIFVRKTILKKKWDKHDGKNAEKCETLYTIGGNIHINMWKTVWKHLGKLKIKLPYDLEIPLLGKPNGNKTTISKRHLYSHNYCNTIQSNKAMKTKYPLTDELGKKM